MRAAVSLARRGFGQTHPNPSVGCVVASRDGSVIYGAAHTARGGRPHAEAQALRQAGDHAKGSTVAVTLEPCCHHEKSCSALLVQAGVARVVVGITDDDPRMQGGGIDSMRRHGIEVVTPCCESLVNVVHGAHRLRHREHRPSITLKTALSIDGQMAAGDGSSQWISGDDARRYGHFLRCRHDAVMIGSGTLRRDNPRLTARIAGVRQPIRIVLGGTKKQLAESYLSNDTKRAPVWWMTHQPQSVNDVTTISLPQGFSITDVCHALYERGITRLLVEGGARLASSFLRAGVVDQWVVMRGSVDLGGGGIAMKQKIESMSAAHHYERAATRIMEDTIMTLYHPPHMKTNLWAL